MVKENEKEGKKLKKRGKKKKKLLIRMIISVNQASLNFYEMDGSGRMALSPK